MLEKKIKPKKCKACKEPFTPYRPLQNVCSPKCASDLARIKQKEKEDRADKIKFHDMKIRAKARDYVGELQKEINKLARAIDTRFHYRCIDCGADYGNQADGAHFHNVGSNPAVRFNLHNVHKATSHCNQFSSEHKAGYIDGIRGRYGEEYLEMLQGLPLKYKTTKLTPQEVYDKLAIVRRLNREVGKMKFSGAIKARDILNKSIGIYLI